ncbi:SMI1/KNR4 family protein [Streptomyces sp. Wh19]|uniref:SMI1/KNR4 family protein n=1 Tax=Streptomyces sanglieri TaxID=193460 RepID=A0ABW2XB29_9ACTN|nr:SMI1/KNR4 family protein [Streptomyces sp. Wh19]MDV9194219.1 SMI1/KNR4 family protein [Streptomyces sp. Wh19]
MPNHEEAIGPAIAVLSEALHRADVNARFGRCPAADLQTVARNLPLPAELLSLYGTYGPLGTVDVPAPLGSMTLTPARDLVSYQSGYRRHSNQGHRLNEWPDEWVVIADHSGDPFIADTAVPGTRVGIAVHGTGSWRPFWVAPTPADFVMLLACFTESYVVEYLNGPGGDEDDEESRPPAYHDRLAALLRDRAPAVDAVEFLKYLCQ